MDLQMTPYTWDSLATLGGATAATLLIVQLIKGPLDNIVKIPTRWLTWVIAFLLLLAAHAFTTGIGWQDIPLLAVNAFLVTFGAMGAYETTFATGDRAKAAAAAARAKGSGAIIKKA